MAVIILSSESQENLNLILKLAEKLGISTKKLTKDEIEEFALSNAIKEGETGEYVDTNSFLNDLEDAS